MVDKLVEEPVEKLSTLKKQYGSVAENKEIAQALTDIGHAYNDAGAPHLALPYFMKALKMGICSHGKEASSSTFVAEAYSNVGSVLTDLNRFQSATEYLGNALRVYQAAQRCNLLEINDDIARMYNFIGVLMRRKCEFKASQSFHTKALALLHLEHGTAVVAQDELAMTYKYLGELYMAQYQFEKSIQSYCTALEYFQALSHIPSGFPLHHVPAMVEIYTQLSAGYCKFMEYDLAKETLRKAADIVEDFLNAENHWVTAIVHSTNGDVCRAEGFLTDAQMCYDSSIEALATYYGSEDSCFPKLVEAYIGHADVSVAMCDVDTAESYYKRALKIMEDIYVDCSTSTDLARVHNSLGSFYFRIGKYNESLVHHDKGMTMLKTTLGNDRSHAYIAETYDNIGKVYAELGDHKRACSYHSKSYDMNMSLYGSGLSEPLVENHINLGNVYLENGNCQKALESYNSAQVMMSLLYAYRGTDFHPAYIKVHLKLAAVKQKQRKYDECFKEINEALSIAVKVYDATSHVDIARVYICQGDLRFSLENYYDAELSYTRASQVLNEVAMNNYHSSADLARVNIFIGRIKHMQHNFEKAIDEYDNATRVLLSLGLKDHPLMAMVNSYSGDAYAAAGNLTCALDMYLKALNLREEIFSEFRTRLDVAKNLHDVGVSYFNIGLHNDALSYLADAVACKQRIYCGKPHMEVALSYDAIGDVYHSKGEFKESIKYYKQSVKLRQDLNCNNYQRIEVADGYRLLAKAYTGLKDYKCASDFQAKSLEIYKWFSYDDKALAKYAQCLEEMAFTLGEQGEWCQARARLQEAFQVGKNAAQKLDQKLFENEKFDYFDMDRRQMATDAAQAIVAHHEFITMQVKARVHFKLGRAYYLDSLRVVYSGVHRDIRYDKLKESLNQLRESMQLLLAIHGSDCNHVDLAETHSYLGRVYTQLSVESLCNDNYDSALKHHNESLTMRNELFSKNSNRVDIAVELNEIGHIYCLRKEYKDAIEHCKLALEMLEKIHVNCSDKLEIAHVRENMGLILRDQKDFKTALQQFTIAYNIKCKIFGHFDKLNLELANINAYLADIYDALGQTRCSLKHHAVVNKITYPSEKE